MTVHLHICPGGMPVSDRVPHLELEFSIRDRVFFYVDIEHFGVYQHVREWCADNNVQIIHESLKIEDGQNWNQTEVRYVLRFANVADMTLFKLAWT